MCRPWNHALLVMVCLAIAAPKLHAEQPLYIDDEKLATDFSAKLIELAKNGKCLKPDELRKQLGRHKCKVAFQKPETRALTPEEVYAAGAGERVRARFGRAVGGKTRSNGRTAAWRLRGR